MLESEEEQPYYKIDVSKLERHGKLFLVLSDSEEGRQIFLPSLQYDDAKHTGEKLLKSYKKEQKRKLNNKQKYMLEDKKTYDIEKINNFHYLEQLPAPALQQVLLNMDKTKLSYLSKNSRKIANISKQRNFQLLYTEKHGMTKRIFCINPAVITQFTNMLNTKGLVSFPTLDNGGQPFRISVKLQSNKIASKLKVQITDNTTKDGYPRKDSFLNFKMVFENVGQLWLGAGSYDDYYDTSAKHYTGNTVLLVIGNKCISVSSSIIEFYLHDGEYITKYISTVGNSAVPYGWIETNLAYIAIGSFNCVNINHISYLPRRYVEELDINDLPDFFSDNTGNTIEEKLNMSCWPDYEIPFVYKQMLPQRIIVPRYS